MRCGAASSGGRRAVAQPQAGPRRWKLRGEEAAALPTAPPLSRPRAPRRREGWVQPPCPRGAGASRGARFPDGHRVTIPPPPTPAPKIPSSAQDFTWGRRAEKLSQVLLARPRRSPPPTPEDGPPWGEGGSHAAGSRACPSPRRATRWPSRGDVSPASFPHFLLAEAQINQS